MYNVEVFKESITGVRSFLIKYKDEYVLINPASSMFMTLLSMEHDANNNFSMKKLSTVIVLSKQIEYFSVLGMIAFYRYFIYGLKTKIVTPFVGLLTQYVNNVINVGVKYYRNTHVEICNVTGEKHSSLVSDIVIDTIGSYKENDDVGYIGLKIGKGLKTYMYFSAPIKVNKSVVKHHEDMVKYKVKESYFEIVDGGMDPSIDRTTKAELNTILKEYKDFIILDV